MHPLETGSTQTTALAVLQYLALVPLLISAGLAFWRTVTDYARGRARVVADAGRRPASAGGWDRAPGERR